jgi:hypothetical protein
MHTTSARPLTISCQRKTVLECGADLPDWGVVLAAAETLFWLLIVALIAYNAINHGSGSSGRGDYGNFTD